MTPGARTDILGNALVGTPDIGPYEYGATQTMCTDQDTRSCDTGLEGICADGTQICTAGEWGTCEQDLTETTEICDNTDDDDCDGSSDCSDSDCSSDPDCLTGCMTSSDIVWNNIPFDPQTAVFVAEYDVIPDRNNIDGFTGLSESSGSHWRDFAVITLFNTTGFISARDGDHYDSAVDIPYLAGTTYHIKIVIDVDSKTYDVFVTPQGSPDIQLASDYDFRTEQASVSQLSNIGVFSTTGTHEVCDFQLGSTQQTYHEADTDENCEIDIDELMAFMNRWRVSIADVGMVEMMEAIGLWKGGNCVQMAPEPVPGAFPNETNTGLLTDRNSLIDVGSVTLSTEGMIYEGYDVAGQLTIDADDITVRNCYIQGGAWYGIYVNSGVTGLTIEDCEIGKTGSNSMKGIYFQGTGSGSIVRRCNIHHCEDGIWPGSGMTVRDNYIHDMDPTGTSHNDAMQVTGRSDVYVYHNTMLLPDQQTSCILVQAYNGQTISDWTVENNYLNGGAYTIYFEEKEAGGVIDSSNQIINNHIGRDYQHGYFNIESEVQHSGNVWADTLEAID